MSDSATRRLPDHIELPTRRVESAEPYPRWLRWTWYGVFISHGIIQPWAWLELGRYLGWWR